jgi:hypothetical protein
VKPPIVSGVRVVVVAILAPLLSCAWARAEQSQRPLPGTYTLGDGPVPSVCVEEGVSLRLEPTTYVSVGDALKVRRVHEGKPEDMSLQDAINRGLLACRSRETGGLGLVFERRQPGEYVLTVPDDAAAVVARSVDVRERIEPLVSQKLPRVPDGLTAKELEAYADQVNRAALARRGPQQDQWRQLRDAGHRELRAACDRASLALRREGTDIRLDGAALVVPKNPVFRELLAAIRIVRLVDHDADTKAAVAKWPAVDEELVVELVRLKSHQVVKAVVKGDDAGVVWLRRDGMDDLELSTPPAADAAHVISQWAGLADQADLVIDPAGLPPAADAHLRRHAAPAMAAVLRQFVPSAKLLVATSPAWEQNVRRMWADGPAPVGVIVQTDSMGEGFGEIHNQIVGMFNAFERLDASSRFGVVAVPPGEPGALAELAKSIRESKRVNGVPVEGRQWVVIACGEKPAATAEQVDALTRELAAAGAVQVVHAAGPVNGLAATAAIGELFNLLDAAGVNPVDVLPVWVQAQSDARRGLLEIRPSAEAPAGAIDLLKGAAEQLAKPEVTSSASI